MGSMVKDTANFNGTRDLSYDLEQFMNELSDVLRDAKGHEIRDFQDALIHLQAFREEAIKLEAKVNERIELERLEEMAERDSFPLQTVDGLRVTFNAPHGFEAEPHRTVYTYDLCDLEVDGDKILSAFTTFPIRRELTEAELSICNSTFKLVRVDID